MVNNNYLLNNIYIIGFFYLKKDFIFNFYNRLFNIPSLFFFVNLKAFPISLAITFGVSVDFFSFPYLNDLVQEVFNKKFYLRF